MPRSCTRNCWLRQLPPPPPAPPLPLPPRPASTTIFSGIRSHGRGPSTSSTQQYQDSHYYNPNSYRYNEAPPAKEYDAPYIYTSTLDVNQVRIIALHPCHSNSDPIVATLLPSLLQADGAVPFDSEDHRTVGYEALSYSWGVDVPLEPIYVNNQQVLVRPSLAGALRALRDAEPYAPGSGYGEVFGGEVKYLWVDALCIKQSDDAEKSREIQKNFKVYHSAVRTIVWLDGEGGRGGQESWDGMSPVRAAMRFLGEFDPEVVHGRECSQGLGFVFHGMGLIADKPYWQRTWVRQEVFAGRDVVVRTGQYYLPLETMRDNLEMAAKMFEDHAYVARHGQSHGRDNGLEKLRKIVGRFRMAQPADATLLASTLDRMQLKTNPVWSLDRMLRGSADFKATEPKDFVYGIVSMTATKTFAKMPNGSGRQNLGPPLPPRPRSSLGDRSPMLPPRSRSASPGGPSPEEIALPISYGDTLAQVYADTTVYLMKFHQSLDPMLLASVTGPRDPRLQLPSWVPNWQALPRSSLLDKVWVVMDRLCSDGTAYAFDVAPLENSRDQPQPVDLATKRTILGARHCSHFSDMRHLMHESAQFHIQSHGSALGLVASGTLLGTIREKRKFTAGDRIGHGLDMFFKEYHTRIKYARRFLEYYVDFSETHKLVGFEASQSEPPRDFQYPKKSRRDKRSIHPAMTEDLNSWHIATSAVRKTLNIDTNSCFAPVDAEHGDVVVLFRGCSLPVVLRVVDGVTQTFSLIGPLLSPEYIIEEAWRRWDGNQEVKRRARPNTYWPSWPGFGPIKEDLPIQQFTMV